MLFLRQIPSCKLYLVVYFNYIIFQYILTKIEMIGQLERNDPHERCPYMRLNFWKLNCILSQILQLYGAIRVELIPPYSCNSLLSTRFWSGNLVHLSIRAFVKLETVVGRQHLAQYPDWSSSEQISNRDGVRVPCGPVSVFQLKLKHILIDLL